jgi:hypothetical protein
VISNATVEFVLSDSRGTVVGSWLYAANGQGWFNATGARFPSAVGTYTLQANATSFFYAGLKTVQVSVATPSYALFAYFAIAIPALVIIALLLFRRRTILRKGNQPQTLVGKNGPKKSSTVKT